jgi:FkbM family methyltransferase
VNFDSPEPLFNQYFLPEMYEQYSCSNEIIIDGGARDGDTLIKFVDFFGPRIKRIYSFEPKPDYIEEIRKIAELYKNYDIRVMPYALDAHNAKANFCLTKTKGGHHLQGRCPRYIGMPHMIEGQITVETRALDHLIPDEEKITFIKMDIEGAEFAALKGARRIIKKHKPGLAICIYHNPEDYIRIPKLIKAMAPEYKLFVRHYHKLVNNTTILYAFV